MGVVEVYTTGSFREHLKRVSAQAHGHAAAVEEVIGYLVKDLLPWSIQRDLELAAQGHYPSDGFGETIKKQLEKKDAEKESGEAVDSSS